LPNNAEEKERQEYLEERKLLINAEVEGSKSFDKAILTLSASAIGLSITFIQQLTPTPQVEKLLYVAWSGFILALLSTLSSFLLSQSALRRQREIIDQYYENKKSAQKLKNWQAIITNWLNWLSIVFFIVGVIHLVLFSINNFP